MNLRNIFRLKKNLFLICQESRTTLCLDFVVKGIYFKNKLLLLSLIFKCIGKILSLKHIFFFFYANSNKLPI